jgi:hypothetical protein
MRDGLFCFSKFRKCSAEIGLGSGVIGLHFGLLACSFPSQRLIRKMLTAPVLSDRFYLKHKFGLPALAMLI